MNLKLSVRLLLLTASWFASSPAATLTVSQVYLRYATEGNTFRFQVSIDSPQSQPIPIHFESTGLGTAVEGIDFVHISGAITIPANELSAEASITNLLYNPQTNLLRTVDLLFSPSADASIPSTHFLFPIYDYDLPASLDPLFKVDFNSSAVRAPFINSFAVQPDGKIMVSGWNMIVGGFSTSLARLMPDGKVDPTFVFKETPFISSLFVAPDRKILITGSFEQIQGHPYNGMARLLPNGRPDDSFRPDPDFEGATIACTDALGRPILNNGPLRRANLDGSNDAMFENNAGFESSLPCCSYFVTVVQQNDGRIVVVSDDGNESTLRRLNLNGSQDTSFNVVLPTPVNRLLALSDGRIVAGASFSDQGLFIISSDGTNTSEPLRKSGISNAIPLVEMDHYIYFSTLDYRGRLRRLRPDGTLDTSFSSPAFTTGIGWRDYLPAFAVPHQGALLCGGHFSLPDGVPMNPGIIRFRLEPPVSALALTLNLAPLELITERTSRTSVRIQRLGSAEKPVTVDYSTHDGRAVAGINYVSTRGTLSFAPFELEKYISIPLLQNELFQGVPDFFLQLDNASLPIELPPALRIRIYDEAFGILPDSLHFEPYIDASGHERAMPAFDLFGIKTLGPGPDLNNLIVEWKTPEMDWRKVPWSITDYLGQSGVRINVQNTVDYSLALFRVRFSP